VPIRPSDLPWWGWLLSSFGAWAICLIAKLRDEEGKGFGRLAISVSMISGFAGFITGAMALILFVKWVWTG
jgi:hypothetical protein